MSRSMMLCALLACGVAAVPAVAQTGSNYPMQSSPSPYGGPQEYYQPQPPNGSSGQFAPQQGASKGARLVEKFRAANTTNDGRLTLYQAEAAGLTPVVRHFAELDPTNKGFVTLQDIRGYMQSMRAMKAQQNPVE